MSAPKPARSRFFSRPERPAPGPVRTLADLSPEEVAHLRATAKPPKKPDLLPTFACERKPEAEPVELVYLRMVTCTPKALLLMFEDGKQRWVPLSHVVKNEVMSDGTGLVTVRAWLIEQWGKTP